MSGNLYRDAAVEYQRFSSHPRDIDELSQRPQFRAAIELAVTRTVADIANDIERRGFPRLAETIRLGDLCPHDRLVDVTGLNSANRELLCARCGFRKSVPRRTESAEVAYDEYEHEVLGYRIAARTPFDWARVAAGCPQCQAQAWGPRGMRWDSLALWCLGCGWSSNWPVPR